MITNCDSTGSTPGHRLFFALWPDQATRLALMRRQAGIEGKPTAPEKLHLTLAFLGLQAASALPDLRAILERVPARPMLLELDTYGHFSGPRIAWAGMRAAPPALFELHDALMRELTGQGLLDLQESTFRPHVTLARNARAAPAAPFAALRWPAAEMALVESSVATGRYQVLARRRLD